jgi:hypothetical protein
MREHNVTVKCSGCKELVEGVRGNGFTGGFYDVAKGEWSKFARPGEKRLCDVCMWSRPEYQLVYGVQGGAPDNRDTTRGRLVAARLKASQQASLNDIAQIFGPNVNTPVHRGVKREQT